ncbi:hypothetical protein GGI07_003410 [Coemansia sp. Benny D115]|nr:hypothetical protein GGI07_003410 [Coemansia sp. Benny D115]
MRLSFVPLLISVSGALTVFAHTHIRNIIIDDHVYDRGQCIRPYKTDFSFPVKDPLSPDLACRTTNMNATDTELCPIKAGSSITLEWHQDTTRDSVAIQSEHFGPCIVYMAQIQAKSNNLNWFKVFESGYTNGKWCSLSLNDNGGLLNVTVPADLKAGDYVMRGEIIALPEAERVYAADLTSGAQYYPNCVQLTVTGGKSSVPSKNLVNFPNAYSSIHPGILFNIDDLPTKGYTIPGPPVYVSGSSSS